MPINITWDEPRNPPSHHTSNFHFPPNPHITETSPRKLRRRVSFATSVKSDVSANTDTDRGEGEKKGEEAKVRTKKKSNAKFADEDDETSPPTKSSWLPPFDLRSKKPSRPLPTPPTQSSSHPTKHPNPSQPQSGSEWQHHDRYFPSFSPETIFPTAAPSSPPPVARYTFTSPFENALTPIEEAALKKSTLSGTHFTVQYPELPAFKDYLQGKTPEAIGWQTSKWGNSEGWKGYGWTGEVLPDKEGRTFSLPMGEGILPPAPPKKGKKGKGKGGDGGADGTEGAGADGGDDGGDGEENDDG